ncbi:MAG: four helix bundle protein [Bacteroidota bacterium]
MEQNKYPLDERLIEFSVRMIEFIEELPEKKSAIYLGGQLLRSGTSPALNYGESRAAESRKDFIHKIKVCLKELRESHNCLKILYRSKLFKDENKIQFLLTECNELISIFVKSIKTAMINTKNN